ncbi:MAG: FAD-dependent oxidoreductase [Sodalis sp. (in: enterobacteria)]|uniref:FAD-dependent oxidoreductase n=1 Tax=Sodalis sp. (in: enterobacteria) TaxID=1898979 RepID=UPI0039E64C99
MYTLTGEDVAEGRKFDDVVSCGYFPIDIHNPNGAEGYRQDGQGGHWIDLKDTYDIPLRCLVPANIDGIVLSCRCISGTSQAHGSYRTQGGIMGISQASGVVAGLCAIQGSSRVKLTSRRYRISCWRSALHFGAINLSPVAMF